jgi:hypothetical protein
MASFVVRDTPSLEVYRMTDSAFLDLGQIGFLGMARSGATYIDTGSAIRAYRNAAS